MENEEQKYLMSPLLAAFGNSFNLLKNGSYKLFKIVYDKEKYPYLLFRGDDAKKFIDYTKEIRIIVSENFKRITSKNIEDMFEFD